MNLLDILSAGKRGLNEENVSSFLAWLLDPGQSHGCGALFLKRLLEIIDKDKFSIWTEKLINTVSYRQLSPIKVDVMVEETVENPAGRRSRDVDIVIILSNGESSHILAIENKIRESAYDDNQIIEEYEGLVSGYSDAEISFLYLTPSKSDRFRKAFSLLPENITSLHLSWTKGKSNEITFADIMRNILRDDSEAKIDPLSQEVRFVLKSFILFAENGFRSQAYKETPATAGSGNRTKYFKGIVTGLEGVESLFQENKQVFIGYLGGIPALQEADLDKIENRPFKWDDKLDGKNHANWIVIDKFLKIIEQKGWTRT